MTKRKQANYNLQSTTQKDREYNDQKKIGKQQSTKHYIKGQRIQCPKENRQTTIYKALHKRTDSTMTKRKQANNNLQSTTQNDREYNDQKKIGKQQSTKHYTEGQTIQ